MQARHHLSHGGCACGAIRFVFEGAPTLSLNCHCRDCQRASGTAYASFVVVPASSFRLLQGEPTYHTVTSDKHHRVGRGFCPSCGSPLLGRVEGEPHKVIVQAASLDDPSVHRPQADIYSGRAQPWDRLPPDRLRAARSLNNEQLEGLLKATAAKAAG